MLGHTLEFGRIHSRYFGGMGFKFRGVCVTKIFSAPYRQNYVSDANMFRRCKNGTDLLYNRAKFGGAQTSYGDSGRKSLTFFV